MNQNGGFPPIKKDNIKKKVKNSKKNNQKNNQKKYRFSTTNVSNVKLQDILSFVKIKKEEKNIIKDELIDTIDSL